MSLNFHLVLASESPRRRQLLSEAGFQFSVRKSGYEEVFSNEIAVEKMAAHLSEQKAEFMYDRIGVDEVILTADTVVINNQIILGKPTNPEEAVTMIASLSGKTHQVITGCTLRSTKYKTTFDDLTEVTFRELTSKEIRHYVELFKPYDKAGAYGIQEWLGMIGITAIKGSYFNVVGLPVHKVYSELLRFPHEDTV